MCEIQILTMIIGLYPQQRRQHNKCSGVYGLHFLTLDNLSEHIMSIAVVYLPEEKSLTRRPVRREMAKVAKNGKCFFIFYPHLWGKKHLGFVSLVDVPSGRHLMDHPASAMALQWHASIGALLL